MEVPGIAVLIAEGFQVPVIPFDEVPASEGGVLFWHRGAICVNAGLIFEVVSISRVATHAQPTLGVKL